MVLGIPWNQSPQMVKRYWRVGPLEPLERPVLGASALLELDRENWC
jgi:hypothetical protein